MEKIIAECESLDYSWLPRTIGDFRLVVTKELKSTEYRLFHYENDLGWQWEALYDKEVGDYTVHVVMPLFTFVDINFIRTSAVEFWDILQERMERELEGLLIHPEERFTYEYRQKGLDTWDFSSVMPDTVGDFILDINPAKGVRMINGSYIIGEYRKKDSATGLILFYNVFRDEFFAELRLNNYPEINHDLDAVTISELEEALSQNLKTILSDLEARLS